MKLNHITLHNFRKFPALKTDFHPELTVLVANNGQGKTSLLDALATNLSSFVGAFDGGTTYGFKHSDIRKTFDESTISTSLQLPLSVTSEFSVNGATITALRELKTATGRTTNKNSAAWTAYGKTLMDKMREADHAQTTLPVIAYYGTSRLWSEHRDMAHKAVIRTPRSAGYEDCLSGKSNYKQLRHWMISISQEAAQSRNDPDPFIKKRAALYDTFLQGISQTVDQLLNPTGYSNLRYQSGETLEIRDDAAQIYLPVDSLSDGIRAVVTLAADIAFRCIKLNPQMNKDAPQQTEGIVLIDEVDMHLHPKWQQTILTQLRTAFPKIQFIVTTHSPQVLSTVAAENIRLIEQDENGDYRITTPDFSPLAHESGTALAQIMDTQREPPLPIQDDIRRYEQLVRDGKEKSTEAQNLRQQMEQAGYQFHQSDLDTWRFLATLKDKQHG